METKILGNSSDQILDTTAFYQFFNMNFNEFEVELDTQIENFLSHTQEKISDLKTLPKKRGRKKLRPFNPTKTEIMDKFWLRGFREFMKLNICELRHHLLDIEFWNFFLSKSGNPGKKKKYLSYSRHYKDFLSSNKSFCMVFIAWIMLYGTIKIPRKNFKGNWELYFNYLCTDLVQPCKYLVTVKDIKESLRNLSTVFDKYIYYINDKITSN